ncbi:Cytochrome P450 86A2 [Colletotrichum siamense]|uniref:Cytochrome P450 86A2 n=1 Tax=Colletotrichum siamense TaxID=690259 RepID=UPI0018727D95|nr:Cytochrome P450 86A2 [Colletotrichum siamense]KAF5498055.1 Cytochrome P450 86A2 [Colletotrichum siamense]
MSSTLVIVFLCASYALYSLLCLIRNIRIAKTIGIPVVWSPISPFNPFWIIFNKRLSPIIQRLPLSLGNWTQHNALDWTWVDRVHRDSQVHEKLGDTFAHATPREIEIHTRDPAVADEVLRKRANEFPKISHYASKLHPNFPKVSSKRCLLTTIVTEVLDFLGTSLVSSDGEDWVRHRKATVSTLSDRNNRLVWTETVRQTQQMIQHYFSASSGRIIDPVEDVREVYLHVFTGVCFGVKYDFRQAAEKYIPEGHSRSYKDCLHTSLKDLLILRLVPKWILDLPVLPHRISNFRDSAREMRQYLDEMIASSKEELEEKGIRRRTQTDNLLSFMVKSNGEIEAKNASSEASLKRNCLTESEIRGNLFTYSLGGHESSAHTLTFALYLLAALPEEQEWLAAETTSVLGQKTDWQSEESFMEVFPRLKRCQAVMNETLRLFPSVTVLPKCTGSESTTLPVSGSDRHIPPSVNVYVNMPSIQIHKPVWGPDATSFRPSRWITSSQSLAGLENEQLRAPPEGAFLPWSDGKRICPGKRFSQVGFVAALAAILLKHRIEVVPDAGESMDDARKRTLRVVNNTYAVMTVHMYEPSSVKLELIKR